jgi:hypothetical protein
MIWIAQSSAQCYNAVSPKRVVCAIFFKIGGVQSSGH